ncbi:hypothetical protein V500_10202 [Pseudogymnoascus sp. VKM F-4518 (FW-2643)]|nr:hypothetical protein V500_10202 [Pseudogymnoascus sp. VKM F-4518 (FW-2643)]
MVKLMQIYAPSDMVRESDLKSKWEKVQNGKGREIEAWLFEWETLSRKCVKADLPEMYNDRPIRAFLDAISTIDQNFASNWDVQIAQGVEISFRDILVQFRTYYKNISVRKKARTTQAVFTGATFQGRDQEGETNEGGSRREFPPCLCDAKHQWKDCLYIMDFLRPQNWRMDEATLKKVQERIGDPEKSFRKPKIEQVYIKTRDEWQKTKGNANTIRTNGKGSRTNEVGNKLPSNFATFDCTKKKAHTTKSSKKMRNLPMNFASYHAQNANATRTNNKTHRTNELNTLQHQNNHLDDEPKQFVHSPRSLNDGASYLTQEEEKYAKYGLAKSTILDSGSTTHICNDRSRMYDYVEQKGSMLAGKAECQILGYGKVRLTLSEPRGVKEITLHNVAYIPGFLTNIASLDQMNEKDVHWDSRTRELYHKNGVLCYTPRYYGQTVLQYVPIDATFFGQIGKDLVQTEEKSVIEETSSKDDPPNKLRSYNKFRGWKSQTKSLMNIVKLADLQKRNGLYHGFQQLGLQFHMRRSTST